MASKRANEKMTELTGLAVGDKVVVRANVWTVQGGALKPGTDDLHCVQLGRKEGGGTWSTAINYPDCLDLAKVSA